MLLLNRQVYHHATRRHIEEAPVEEHALADLIGKKHPRIVFGRIDQQMGGITDLVAAFIGDNFEIIEPIDSAIKLRPVDPEDGIALDLLSGGIAGYEGDAVLALLWNRITE